MSWKQGHDCYTDDIKVKISERYKPPPRINIAVTYAQRLILNQQTQDNIPNYEFNVEKKVLANLNEWKRFRATASQERRTKIEKAREEIKRKEKERIEQEQLDEVELKTVQETATTTSTNNNFNTTPSVPFHSSINQSYGNYSTNSSILVPTQATNHYSNILTPIPLQNYGNQQYNCKKNDKSPFNISDFENDTASPFDNMELKSINDMEELAQVLNKEKNYETNTPVYSNYPNVQPATSHMQPQYSNYPNNQFSYNIPSSVSYVQPPTSDYSRTNGYYYPQNQTLQQQYFYSKPNTLDYRYGTSIQCSPFEMKTPNCKSVPDIVKAVEDELENTHLNSTSKNSFIRTNISSQTSRPKSTDAVYPRPKIKTENLDDPFDLLTITQQEVCRSICSMGFPLPRVARTFKIFGNDQKKMVEHLLALTDLLDLGFPEKDVSNALVQSDNDRDKALDKLIS